MPSVRPTSSFTNSKQVSAIAFAVELESGSLRSESAVRQGQRRSSAHTLASVNSSHQLKFSSCNASVGDVHELSKLSSDVVCSADSWRNSEMAAGSRGRSDDSTTSDGIVVNPPMCNVNNEAVGKGNSSTSEQPSSNSV